MSKDQVNNKPAKPKSDQDKIAICKRWKASGLSLERFCAEHCVAKSTLYKWTKKYHINPDVGTSSFARLSPSPESSSQEKISMELKLPNGSTLHLNLSAPDAVTVIQELSHAASIIR